jgi:hypothetical protein
VKSKFIGTAVLILGLVVLPVGVLSASGSSSAKAVSTGPFLSTLGAPTSLGSTVPSNGDVNPYGVAIVTKSVGDLVAGSTLVSNFNDKANVQGTGMTIVEVSPSKHVSVFATITNHTTGFRCPGGIGLTTALNILPGGWVIVGSIGAGPHGTLPNAKPAGCLIVVNNQGVVKTVWSNPFLNGPWDMAAVVKGSTAQLYVSDVMPLTRSLTIPRISENCEVVRVDVQLKGEQTPNINSYAVLAKALSCRPDKASFVLGPTGIAISANGTAYVAETIANEIFSIPLASTRTTPIVVSQNIYSRGGVLRNPLGLAIAPNGDVLALNASNGNVVEIDSTGKQVASKILVRNGSGALFGLSVTPNGKSLQFVNDIANTLEVASGR